MADDPDPEIPTLVLGSSAWGLRAFSDLIAQFGRMNGVMLDAVGRSNKKNDGQANKNKDKNRAGREEKRSDTWTSMYIHT